MKKKIIVRISNEPNINLNFSISLQTQGFLGKETGSFPNHIVRSMEEVKVWTRKTGCMGDGLLINVDNVILS